MDTEERLRYLAIKRHLAGEAVAAICSSIGRTRQWFYRWWRRYHTGESKWYRRHSCSPRRHGRRIDDWLEQEIIRIRHSLLEDGLFHGAEAIVWELEDRGLMSLPSVRTVARIISRHNLVVRRTGRYVPKGKKYPQIGSGEPGEVHQTDFVGPCYLSGGYRFYSLHSMDIATNRCAVEPLESRDLMVPALWNSWLRLGLPRYQQVDNEWVFFGSPRHPRGMGKLIRLCLLHGVEPVFIPPREPWRNGVVEKFNDHWRQKFYNKTRLADPEQLRCESLAYELRHNRRYRYSELRGMSPLKALETSNVQLRYPVSQSPPARLKKPETGFYHLIRFIRGKGLLDVFSEKFKMPSEVRYEYVRATVDVAREKLKIYLDGRQIEERDYFLR